MKIAMLVIIIIGVLFFSFNKKLSMNKILAGHIKSLRNDKKNKISIVDCFTFLVLPFILALIITLYYKAYINDISIMLTVFSVFTALLFNFLILIIQMKDQNFSKTNIDIDKYKMSVSETYYNVSFAILISIFAIAVLLILSMINKDCILYLVFNVLSWGLIITFFLDLIMILKRIFAIYSIKQSD